MAAIQEVADGYDICHAATSGLGTSDWYGATLDPQRKLMFINTTFIPFKLQMLP